LFRFQNKEIPKMALEKFNQAIERQTGYASSNELVTITPFQIQRHQKLLQKDLPNQPFPVAARFWLREHSRYVSSSTIDYYEQYTVSLSKFFGDTILRTITMEDIRAYQDWRAVNEETASAGAGRCNMETWALQAILKEANLWHKFVKHYRPLPITREKKDGSGQCFTPEQIEKIKAEGQRRTKRHLAHHCLMLMLYTGMGFGELRMVERGQLDLENKQIRVLGGAKNDERDRVVPLNVNALPHAEWLLQRWVQLGGVRGSQFLLPSRPKSIGGPWDFERPMKSIKTAWYAILKDAGLHEVAWKRLRIYDCRVTAVTRVLKGNKVSLHTAKKFFGHVSEAMQRRYYKPELALLHEAAKELEERYVEIS
jgi:integrase